MLQAHPKNLNCLSKFSLNVRDPDCYQLMGKLMEKFNQLGPRITEFKAVISNYYCIRHNNNNYDPFKTIEKILEQMTSLKSLELDGDPYWINEKTPIETRPYPLEKFKTIRGL